MKKKQAGQGNSGTYIFPAPVLKRSIGHEA